MAESQDQQQYQEQSTESNVTTIDDDGDDDYTDRFFIQVSENLPSLQECSDFVNDPSCGAISTFVGITRDNFQGKRVTKLSYEGYVPMAEKELHKLCRQACQKYQVYKIAAVHILGDCPVGQASVVLACSSPHRRDALHCVEFLIDTLKARVPIWKREWYDGDDAVWKENVEWKNGKEERVMVKENGE
ncbi:molybdopterin biosynthesis MoaE protein [Nitzschia inconspicua]|uniref:Molybdopterin synthase catalytic subunit n=1 Tax=Nitzschia inconspicua TaxID=303405 RepID=A0A9K3K9F0_9STRA|nr:molybdopterin biosynthesis MoaE protein [Nitzschia inconspicua]KAG7340109.1 molybdopterin biosynthesis MoaE protein [Nitzschia inconspicua]